MFVWVWIVEELSALVCFLFGGLGCTRLLCLLVLPWKTHALQDKPSGNRTVAGDCSAVSIASQLSILSREGTSMRIERQ